MATSSKTQFKLETLKEQSLAALDEQLRLKEEELARAQSADSHAEDLAAWRERCVTELEDLYRRRLEPGADTLFATYRFPKMPQRDRYQVSQLERDVERLKGRRVRIIAKAESLVPDADGNLSLTKTQLSEFFGL